MSNQCLFKGNPYGVLFWITNCIYIANLTLFVAAVTQGSLSSLKHCLEKWQLQTPLDVTMPLITLRQRPNGRHFPDNIFKCIFLNENVWILITISLKFVPKGPINNILALIQIMAWHGSGDKPLSEPMLVGSLTHICITQLQWVKQQSHCIEIMLPLFHVPVFTYNSLEVLPMLIILVIGSLSLNNQLNNIHCWSVSNLCILKPNFIITVPADAFSPNSN